MLLSADGILSGLYLFSAPFLRISAMMIVAPVFSAPGFNLRARVLLSVLVAALVAPQQTRIVDPSGCNLRLRFCSASATDHPVDGAGVGCVIDASVGIPGGPTCPAGGSEWAVGLGHAPRRDAEQGCQKGERTKHGVLIGKK